MPTADQSQGSVYFADYHFGADKILLRDGVRLRLKYQSTLLLSLLLDHAGQTVTREQIRKALWPADTFVDFDQGINNCIREIRSVLHDNAENPRYIETVAKLGYRFLAPVRRTVIPSGQSENPLTPPSPSVPVAVPLPADSGSSHALNIFRRPGRLALSACFLVLALTGAWFLWSSSVPTAKQPQETPKPGFLTIAVLPFSTPPANASTDFLGEGVTESVINDLSEFRSPNVAVIAGTSSSAFAVSSKSLEEIGRELKADYVVRGAIEPSGDSFKLTAELLQTRDGGSLWTYKGDWNASTIRRADAEIAHGIEHRLALRSTTPEQTAARLPRWNSRAYYFYLMGRHDLNQRSRASLLRATQEFKSAIDAEPDSGPSYAGLADADNLLAFYGGSPFYQSVVEAQTAARHAIKIDDSIAEAHAALAYSDFMWAWQWNQSEAEFHKALALNPNYAAAHHWYSFYLAAMGRFPEAQREIEKAQQLDPLSPIVYAGNAYVDYMARDYDGAIQHVRLALALNPKLMPAFDVLGLTDTARDDPAGAIQAFHTADQLAGGSIVYAAGLARAYALDGQRDKAREILATLSHSGNASMVPSLQAQVLAGLGDRDQAIASLYKAYENNDPSALWLKVDPQYDSLRSDPKFQALLRRMDFPN